MIEDSKSYMKRMKVNRPHGPRGLSPSDRLKWHELGDLMLQLYDTTSHGDTPRKCVGGADDHGNACIFFKGSEEEILLICRFINGLTLED